MREETFAALLLVFVPLSLLSVGGGPSILAGLQNAVAARGWMSQRDFLDLFAIARAAPGPGVLLATLVGWKVAGIPGAIVASLALFVPSSLLYYAVARHWSAHRGKLWHSALERGLAPVAAALILAGSLVILRASGTNYGLWAIAAASTAILLWRPRLNPLWVLAAGGIAAMLFG
ncbi:MAG TPA: chromate transporter [Stellaceae bacterium]|jgi:chromate transporter|nr:chromate transporter [Stellaceae bacterium]